MSSAAETTVNKLGLQTKHFVISGRVQGVSYRASLQSKAVEYGATGWVRNTAKGFQVEVIIQGVPEVVARVIEWAAAMSSVDSIVDQLDCEFCTQIFHDFAIIEDT